jgi:hypothetical protein
MSLTAITGSAKTSTRSKATRAGMYLQGNEIYSLRLNRSMLPISGRNERYDVFHTEARKLEFEYKFFDDTIAAVKDPFIRFHNEETLDDIIAVSELKNAQRQPTPDALVALARLKSYNDHVDAGKTPNSWWMDNSRAGTIRYEMPEGRIFQRISFSIGTLYPTGIGYDTSLHDKDTPYHDLEKYDAVRYVQNGSPPIGMEPIYGFSPSYDESAIFDGIIEPFEIRSFIFGKSIFMKHSYPGGVFGNIENPESAVLSSNNISFRDRDRHIPPYEDSGTKGFFSAAASPLNALQRALQILDTEYINDEEQYISPFEDRDLYANVTPDSGIINILRFMDATLDEGDLPPGDLPMTTGWVAEGIDKRNSVIFRGLMR